MNRSLLVHGAWTVAAITTFLIGSRLFPAGGDSATNAPTIRGTSSNASRSSIRPDAPATLAETAARRQRNARAADDAEGDSSKTPTLTDPQIEALGEQFRNSTNPIDRRLAFSRMLEALTPENARLMREQIAHLDADSAEFREFHYAWGAIAGKEAVLNGAETPKSDMGAALAGWASSDPDAAASWFKNLDMENEPAIAKMIAEGEIDAEELKTHLMVGLVYGLGDANPDTAAGFVAQLAADGVEHAPRVMGIVTGKVLQTSELPEAGAWAQNLPEGPVRAGAIGQVAGRYASEDPAAAVNWLQSIPASEDKARGMATAFSKWAGEDPVVAGAHLNSMSPSPDRDYAISGYAPRVAHDDPAAAIEWVDSVNDPAIQEQTLIRTGQVYYHRVDKEAAQQWLPTSGLTPEAQQKVINPRGR